ncbi:MAG: transcriptional regulator [Candidatus Marinimicrobia bacterium]|nr:transcriptional regulator [Candidatus Neomarinimicrobiota bacterium]|tara:strand:- start:3646 stop:3993 length:348 start_codon:yes stop_codon:yes gene_type:complete
MADQKIEKLYFPISEVSEITGLKQYVLRYWETEFPSLRPKKNRAGNRTYRQSDIDTILNIKDLLYTQKYTIDGARERLKSGKTQVGQGNVESEKYRQVLTNVKAELISLLKSMDN